MYNTFYFENYIFNEETKTLLLKYSFDGKLFFEEKIEFPTEKILNSIELAALNKIFKYIHLACGISYYKLFVPLNIEIKNFSLNIEEKEFFDNFYTNGLGEFAYRNNIEDIRKRINFPCTNNNGQECSTVECKLNRKYCVAVGGGKDSITTIETLKTAVKDFSLISVGEAESINNTMKLSGLNYFQIKRTVSKNLLELNKQLLEIKGYNGHVPISGILAFIFIACAVIYGFDTILLSNERSANIGNRNFSNMMVNHQWSKSFEFEEKFNKLCKKYIIKNFSYISFLRPLSEIHIAKIFSKFKQYHKIFTSCNKNFKIEGRMTNWCCDCDKCRFVFLILSVFLNKNELLEIFKKNMFGDGKQLQGFHELCGIDGNYKPFECVGEIEESIYAILNTKDDFKNDFVVKNLREKLKNIDTAELEKKLFTIDEKNNLLNSELLEILKNNI